MKYSKELRSPYLQNNISEFTRMNNFLNKFFPKFTLKIYLLGTIDLLAAFRKKVGFDMARINSSGTRKQDILLWCHNNRHVIDSFFVFDRFIGFVNAARKESHLFRIEVFLIWAKRFHE